MMAKLYFVFNTEQTLDPIDCPITTSFAEIYSYIQQVTGGQYDAILSFDQVNQVPNDASPISCVLPQGGETQLYVNLLPILAVSVFLDGNNIIQTSISDTMTIGDFVQQVLYNIQESSPIQDYQLYDVQGQPIAQNVNPLAPFQYYTQGQHQGVTLNLVKQQQAPPQPEQSSPGKKQLSVNAEQDLLAQLVLLPNISLLIDPNGQFVVYKFHFPVLVQGFLRKSQGKQRNINGADFVPFKLNPAVKYADTDDYGFTIQWEDGSFSSIKVKQQQ